MRGIHIFKKGQIKKNSQIFLKRDRYQKLRFETQSKTYSMGHRNKATEALRAWRARSPTFLTVERAQRLRAELHTTASHLNAILRSQHEAATPHLHSQFKTTIYTYLQILTSLHSQTPTEIPPKIPSKFPTKQIKMVSPSCNKIEHLTLT